MAETWVVFFFLSIPGAIALSYLTDNYVRDLIGAENSWVINIIKVAYLGLLLGLAISGVLANEKIKKEERENP